MSGSWVTCPSCGTTTRPDSDRCSTCGADLGALGAPRQQAEARPRIRVRVYRGATQEASAVEFAEDAERAAAAGYEPFSQAWEGAVLTVTYRLRQDIPGPAPAAPVTPAYRPPTPTPRTDAPPVYVKAPGPAGVGQSVQQGFGWGCGCLLVGVAIVLIIIFLGAMGGR